jgi:hypothetical protein
MQAAAKPQQAAALLQPQYSPSSSYFREALPWRLGRSICAADAP